MSKMSKAERKGSTQKTKAEVSTYDLECKLIIPFRPMISPISVSQKFFEDDFETSISIDFLDEVTIDPVAVLNTSHCTYVEIKTQLKYSGTFEEIKNWILYSEFFSNGISNTTHASGYDEVINEIILPRLNYFFMQIKQAVPQTFLTAVIRNIGVCDSLYTGIYIDKKVISHRMTSTGLSNGTSPINFNTKPITNEWLVLTKAVNLVNHGYHLEAFIVGFSLLDTLVQEFIKNNLKSLSLKEAEELLRSIESQRLSRYLGILSKLAIGKTIFDDIPGMETKLTKINTTRNKIMHNGNECSVANAKEGLETILEILEYLKRNGAEYELPYILNFW